MQLEYLHKSNLVQAQYTVEVQHFEDSLDQLDDVLRANWKFDTFQS